jgi:D-lactate dehydrogenase
MRVAVFSTKSYDHQFMDAANQGQHALTFLEPRLTRETVALAAGHDAVCLFVNDDASAENLTRLHALGVRLVVLRSAGFNHVDLAKAEELALAVARVPAYSPYSVAEHTVALILALNRKIHRAHNRVREGNFSLEGLLGFDLRERTVGVIGTGKIGRSTLEILRGFGCQLLAYDPFPNEDVPKLGARYVDLATLFAQSDVISLHCPLTPDTFHLINHNTIAQMKRNVMIINTSRGALVETQAVIDGLKSGQIGYLGLDVYEEEADLFFENLSNRIIQDDLFMRLTTFPNAIMTGHQAFFTEEALRAIAEITIDNVTQFERGEIKEGNLVTLAQHRR